MQHIIPALQISIVEKTPLLFKGNIQQFRLNTANFYSYILNRTFNHATDSGATRLSAINYSVLRRKQESFWNGRVREANGDPRRFWKTEQLVNPAYSYI